MSNEQKRNVRKNFVAADVRRRADLRDVREEISARLITSAVTAIGCVAVFTGV